MTGKEDTIENQNIRYQSSLEIQSFIEASKAVLECDSFVTAARCVFDACRKLTGAASGYVALLSATGQENEVLFLEAGGMPCLVDTSLPMTIRGLRAQAYSKGTVVFENDFMKSEHARFMPHGHVVLRNVMFVPLRLEGNVAGIMGLANKQCDFTEEDAYKADVFGDLAAIALRRSRMDEQFKAVQNRTASILSGITDTFCSLDADWRFSVVNPAAEKAPFGRSASEMIGKVIWELYPSLVGTPIHQRYLDCARNRSMEHYEELSPLNDHWYEVFMQGWTGGIDIYMRDITERKRSELELTQRNKFIQMILDNLPIGLAVNYIDQGCVTYINQKFEEIYGWPREELQNISDFFPRVFPDQAYREQLQQRIIADMQSCDPKRMSWDDLEISKKNGEKRFVLAQNIPLFDQNLMISTVQDITERKRAEEALHESQATFRKLFEDSADAILLIDQNRVFIECNQAALNLLKMSREDFLHRPPVMISPEFQPDGRRSEDAAQEMIDQAYAKGLQRFDWTCVNAEGGEFIVDVSLMPIEIEGQVMLHTTWRDITERKRMEEALIKTQKLESLGILAGGIAHDFNNLMGGIFGYIDIASEKVTDEKATQYLAKAMNAIGRARALTQQLLTFAKGGAPILQINNLFPFVQETAQFALSGANVSCNFHVPDDLWACNFDKNQIGQVIDNLIINAQQAMPVGGAIEVIARNITLAENEHPLLLQGNYVKLSVKDTGVGIPNEVISKIFDPFFTTKTKGQGLGLTTCYSIIHRHGGSLDVESEPGKGSTFTMYLPATTKSASSEEVTNADNMHTGSGTFLIMDDEELIRDTIRNMLETIGYSVVCKENGTEAVDFFNTEIKSGRTFAGMIFDLTVPGAMGGKTAVEMIRKTNKEIPVFVASGYADDPVMKNPTEFGFMASICKPFRKSELVAMLNKYLKPNQ